MITASKKQGTLLITLILVIASGLFYWFQLRPSKIKHDCSWTTKHADAVLERPAMTKEELVSKGIIRSCDTEILELKKVMPFSNYKLGDNSVHSKSMTSIDGKFYGLSNDPLWKATSCIEDGNRIINEYKSLRPAVPAKTSFEKATDEEYKFCLKDKGL